MMRKRFAGNSLEHLQDEELLALLVEGADNRFAGELFKRYAHLVFGVCSKYIRNKTDCKDLTMVIFEKLLAKPPVKDLSSFRSWLFTISKNESLTYLRNNARAAARRVKWENEEKRSTNFMEIEEERSLNNRALKEDKVLEALKQLKPEQQQCIELFFLKEKSYKEIVQETGMDIKKVKSHLQNGKRRLRLLLEPTKE